MKKVLVLASMAAWILASCAGNPEGSKAETTEATEVTTANGVAYTVNPATSKVEWTGTKVTGAHNGTVDIKSGSVNLAEGKLVGGTIVLDLNTIKNLDMEGEYAQKLVDHLKNADFFDVPQFPDATIEITEVKDGATAGTITVSANLTIRGISKNITFDAQVAEATDTAFKATADFNIAREDWGVSYTGKEDDLISKEINFKVNLDATK